MIRIRFSAILFLTIAAAQSSADIIVDDFSDATNDRFTNDAAFVASGLNLSGVGRGDGVLENGIEDVDPPSIKWGTLISPNVVVSANHFRASATGGNQTNTLSFYRNNDPNDVITRSITGGQRIGSSDLYLSVLSAPVPQDVAIYNFVTESISAPAFDEDTNTAIYSATTSGGDAFDGENAFLFGISATDRPDADGRIDQAVGRNRITGYIENLPVNGSNNDTLILLRESIGDPDYVTHEARFSGGDSGAPLFIERNGELLLMGINSAISSSGTQFSAVSYIGNHSSEIDAFILANSVPEPSSAVVLIGFCFILVSPRSREVA